MNKKLLNTQIEALTEKHGAEIVKFYSDNGFKTSSYIGNCTRINFHPFRFYGVDAEGSFSSRKESEHSTKTITLEEAKALVNEKPYPKLMYVWDNDEEKHEKWLVVGKFDKWVIAFNAVTIEDVQSDDMPCIWRFAKDIEEPPIIELTLEEIADKFGHKSSQIRIKE